MSVFVIAEAGVNHNGNLDLAKKLVVSAKESGANAVKFQTFKTSEIVSKSAKKAKYQRKQNDNTETQYDMLKKLELTYDDFLELRNYCKKVDIEFMSTAFDFDSIDFLKSLNMNTWKIPSGEITNLPYLIKIANLNKPVILSTGMSTMEDIKSAIKALKDNGSGELTVLHCTTDYPTSFKDVNLKAMNTINKEFDVKIGYSDHTKGIEVSIAAVALGATVIEKHFTLDRNMEGPDHKASLEPNELKSMVDSIRHIEMTLGNGIKQPTESEKKNMVFARKSIIARKDIRKGELFGEDNLAVKRPGNGISPMKWFDVIGKVSPRDFKEDELIEL
jgi:N,N'-diacetyllegionaminate synthase